MRVYNIPVNADLLEAVVPLDDTLSSDALQEFNNIIRVVHSILEVELYIKVSGAVASAVEGRGCVYKIGDIW